MNLVSRRWKYVAILEGALVVVITAGVAAWGISSGAWARSNAASSEPTFMVTGPQGTQSIARSTLYARLRRVTASVRDPANGEPRRYEGFELRDVLALANASPHSEDTLMFHALDGYSPTMPARRLADADAIPVLAVRDLETKSGWKPVPQGSRQVSPAPFYLVWVRRDGRNDIALPHDDERPWPYQLVGIDVLSASITRALDPRALGSRDAAVIDGFERFNGVCLRCHSINLLGGTMGPELNVPMNITEYRDADTIAAFVHDPPSFRARTAMPAFAGVLSNEEIANIVVYLRFMKDHKSNEEAR